MLEIHVCKRDGTLLRAFALGDSSEVIIGRDESCDIRIMDASVSREHCAVERRAGDFTMRDLGSKGGTFLGGDRIDRIEVEDGLEVMVGPAVLRFVDD